MGKKARRASVDASPPMDGCRVGKDTIDRGRFKHQYLMQDYEELKKETEAKKKQLELIRQKKRRLMTEVKILGKKYLSFLENPSQTTLFGIKKQFNQLSSSSACNNLPLFALSEMKNQKVIEAANPRSTTLLDLNQFSHLDGESHMDALKLDVLNEYEVSQGPDNQTIAICRDAQKNSSRVCRRKSTWQDPAILKV
ncbi:uncharacterized protein LOC141841787 [Curcuma longa]|uniref:uncharacterized protein LOC141841787 n=1 Tax=Curcuma longa TaxID=136217 RepID=UPI003D9E3857